MAPVFAHGRLRLYLLKLLDESPRHGYEVIRLLEERFHGLYAPSAGTVYPRLAKLEKEGLVTHSTEGGRKVYALTDAGRGELADRADEIAGLEAEIRESVSTLAAEIREDVRGAAGDLRREVRAAAQEARTPPSPKREWREQAARAKEESRKAQEEARDARRQAKAAREEVERIARQVQEQVQSHVRSGDWQSGLRDGLAELTKELGRFGKTGGMDAPSTPWGRPAGTPPVRADATAGPVASGPVAETEAEPARPEATGPETTGSKATGGKAAGAEATEPADDDTPPSADPARDLGRLLDRFRDDIRDAAHDLGVDDAQLREVRRHLSTAAAHIVAALHRPSA